MGSFSSSSPPLQRSRVTLFRPFRVNPSKTHKSTSNPFAIFFLFLLSKFSSVASNPSNLSDLDFESTYIRLCNHVVPVSTVRFQTGTIPGIAESLRFQSGYFSGGGRLFNQSTAVNYSKSVLFRPVSVHRTVQYDVYKLRAQLILQHRDVHLIWGNSRRLLRKVYPGRRVSHWRASQWMRVSLNGFWSESSGKLCMFGTGSYGNMQNANVVLKLSYPRKSTILDSLISGTLESFDDMNSLHYFEPISILALSHSSNYKFTLMGKDNENGCVAGSDGESLPLQNLSRGACTVFGGQTDRFELEYGNHCHNVSCNPLGADVEKLPDFMYFYGTRCTERQKVQMLLGFSDSSYHDVVFPFYPNTTLISEGTWDENENRLCAVACRILNFTESWVNPYVGDCSIKLTLRLPAIFSLTNRSTVLGQIWSDKAIDESGYFSKIEFQGSLKVSRGLHGFQYKYTEIDRVRKYCAEKMTATGKGMIYPDGYSSDMRFSMLVRNSKGQVVQGYLSPLFVGDQIYDGQLNGDPIMLTMGKLKAHRIQSDNHSNLLNVSYTMSFKPPPDFKFDGDVSSTEVKIAAEGMYNRNAGLLCTIGCRHLRSTDKKLMKNESLDCEMMVNVQFSPLNAKGGESVKGTLESTREKSDPYYFDPLQLSSYSIYTSQAEASIWRMDFEIIMVLVSNTLAFVFVGLQLFHVKKHPDVLPYISILMLIVITLGHLIPLLLNFEALFIANHSQQNAFLGSGGWLEVNEVVVRVVTMVAFLLELRLLQLAWSSRQGEGSQPGLWASEKMVLYMTLPLYIGGGLTTWFVHRWKNSHQKRFKPFQLSRHRFRRGQLSYQPPSLWEDFKSYAGLLLDGFLLPQILFNIFFNSEGKTMASSFYVGTTIVRILPHAYDLYRAHSSAWYLDLSYIYANHRMDFYSTAWDIIIPCGGLLFALLVYLQQRFGSRCILPKTFRESSAYEKVPVIGNDDL